MRTGWNANLVARAQYRRRGESRYYNRKLTDAQKKLLSPLPEDKTAFAEFLRQSNTGLVKLLPGGKHQFGPTISANEDPEAVLPIRGGGAFYSFSEKTHSFGPWSEITLQKDHLVAGFGYEALGLMISLGDVPLESVTLATPGVQYLASFVPPASSKEAKAERAREFDGFKAGEFTYKAFAPSAANTTYVMRSMVYVKQGRLTTWGFIPHPHEYKGADVIIAFRVVRQHEDGGVTLLWKRLKKFSAPKIKKRER